MLAEEWNDRLQKILTSPYDVAKHVLPKVVVATVRDDNAHAEELTNCFEARDARGALRDCELVSDLVSGSIAASANAVVLTHEAD